MIAPTMNMHRLLKLYALNSSSISPPQITVPMIIKDYEIGTAFSDGYKLSK